jgi:predicted nucleic acid-binding protein
MKLYLDVCCLNRCFDDQRQPRIRLEAEAVGLVLDRVGRRLDQWLTSPIVDAEIRRDPDVSRQMQSRAMLANATGCILWDDAIRVRAGSLMQLGLAAMDALHVAAAEYGACDVFLTTDDRLLKRCFVMRTTLGITVANPVAWISGVTT